MFQSTFWRTCRSSLLVAAVSLFLASCGHFRDLGRTEAFDSNAKVGLLIVGYVVTSDSYLFTVESDQGSSVLIANWCRTTNNCLNGISYVMKTVAPGDYYIKSVTNYVNANSFGRVDNYTTNFYGTTSDGRPITKVGFSVRAGEILYIGNPRFAFQSGFAKLEKVERNDADAKAILAAYPNARGEMQFRPLRPLNAN